MTPLEETALLWIAKTNNIAKDDIVFRHNLTPDFVIPNGIGYEVKNGMASPIELPKRQLLSLQSYGNCYILIYKHRFEPERILHINQITSNGYQGNQFHITITNKTPKWEIHARAMALAKGQPENNFWNYYGTMRAKLENELC